jgi:LPS O-antigen subunit length determinant protein (WzzB/FepE family)
MENPAPPVAYDDEIDLWQLWETVWSGRWLIIAITSLFAVGGVTYALVAQEWWRAEVVLAPADKKGGMSGALSQLSGLASLAGVSVGGGGGNEPLAVLKSKDFARQFITEMNLMPVLLKDQKTEDGKAPDIRDALRIFETVRTVSDDKKTGLVTLSVRWKDADTAALWANELARRVNARLRAEALAEAERNVTYLQKEMAATSVVSLQQSMGRVLEGEMQKLMLARGNEEFAFKVIDKATPPKLRDAPKRALIAIVATLAGGFLGILAVFLRQAWRNRPPRPAPQTR